MYRACLWSLAATLATAMPAFAADAEDTDLLAPRFDLTLWSIVIFVLLYLLLRKFAWGPILDGLKKREQTIANAIDEAKKVRDDMVRQQADFQQRLVEENQKIAALLETARRDAEHLKDEMRTQAAADINEERQRLRREIEVARDQALQDIWKQAANLATVISAQVIRKSLAPDDHRRLVDDALGEIEALAAKDQGRASEVGLEWVRQAGGKI